MRASADASDREMVTVMAETQRACLRAAKIPMLRHVAASGTSFHS
jgi:hypothetical protein